MCTGDTQETNNPRTFEERVFQRFDAVDARLGSIENRLEKLEMKQYETKPIWEQALIEISHANERIGQLTITVTQTNERVDQLATSLAKTDSRVEQVATSVELLRSDMKAEFSTLRNEIEDSFHDVEWKIDVLNNNLLKMQVNHRFIERHLRDLESQSKPT